MRVGKVVLAASAALLALALVVSAPAPRTRADDSAPTSMEKGTFARPIKRVNPEYPSREARRGVEGWVILSYVVTPTGKVIEPVIEDSSGRETFEKAAMRAVEKWTYEPATMEGKAIEQCHTKVRIVFALALDPDRRGARGKFRKQFAIANQLFEEGKLEEASRLIDEIEDVHLTTLYESSRLSILRSLVKERQGDVEAQLASLKRGVSGGGTYVEPKVHRSAMLTILSLQMDRQQYAGALDTLEELEKLDLDKKTTADLARINSDIEAIRTDDRAIAVEGTIGKAQEELGGSGSWSHALLRNTAGIEEPSGELHRVEIRCEWRRVKAKPAAGRAWRIPPEWGACSIFVFGEPGATFELREYASTAS